MAVEEVVKILRNAHSPPSPRSAPGVENQFDSKLPTPTKKNKSDVMCHQQQRNPKSRDPIGRSHSHWRIVNRGKGDRCEQIDGSENIESPYRWLGQATAAQHKWNCCERKDGSYQIAKRGRIRKLRRHSWKSRAASQEHQSQMSH